MQVLQDFLMLARSQFLQYHDNEELIDLLHNTFSINNGKTNKNMAIQVFFTCLKKRISNSKA